jgi:Tfp pilus assembly protein PilF
MLGEPWLSRIGWRHVSAWLSIVVVVAGCRSKPANPEEVLAARSLGVGYLERNRLPEAEEQFKKLVSLAPKDPFGYANLGLTYLQAGRFADAEKQLSRARDLEPTNADVGRMIAKLYALTNRRAEARKTLEELQRAQPRDAKVLYALATLDTQDDTTGVKAEPRLRETLALAPANLAVRLQMLNLFVRRGESDSAVRQLEEIRRLPPERPAEVKPLLTTSVDLLRSGKVAEARPVVERLVNMMALTAPYQASLAEVKWFDDPIVGRPTLTFGPQSVIQLRSSGILLTDDSTHFIDATGDAGLPDVSARPGAQASPPDSLGETTTVATGDFNGDGADDLVASVWSATERRYVTSLYLVERWRSQDITEKAALTLTAGAVDAAVGDFDNDGWLDLFVIGTDARGHLLRNKANAVFEDVSAKSGIADIRGSRKALFVDLDHDGDLDVLLVGGARSLVYRNNLDGTFTEVGETIGLAGRTPAHDAGFADFDNDGRIDVVVATDSGITLYHNTTAPRRFEDATAASGLPATGVWGSVTVADYDNDGTLDLLATRRGSAPELWRNDGTGKFTRDDRSRQTLGALIPVTGLHARFVDVNNDGWLDLVLVGKPGAGKRGGHLLRNDGSGTFKDASALLPLTLGAGSSIATLDVDNDGDMDLVVGDERGVHLLANEGGNMRLSVQIALTGLRTGSGKNNDFGIGARLDLRSREIHQTRVVTSRLTHFGLGSHLKADVLRIQWPNGVPQTVYFPGTDQDVLELETLKGSCAFLYTWDGRGFRFVTDVMWRSALGMPVGLMGGDEDGATMYAPAGASREYLRIPGAALKPRNGRYVLQLTEELWETAYTDEMKLLTVDHPDSVDVFVDERFVPPAPVKLRLYQVIGQRPPLSAVDDRGNDVLAALREHDDVFVSNLTPLRYQGLVEPHDLILDLGPDAGQPGSLVILRGWIYPTDASINVAVSQQSALKPMSPVLEVRGANGQWTPAALDLGFPSGKNKTIVVDLTGKFPTKDHRVRIRTNMQIYWDQAIVAREAPAAQAKVSTLAPLSADLHFRGFSRTYRKGGRYGPHWFNYSEVSKESPWRIIEGAFTRFGNVLPLLERSDDMYIVMAPGDETTVEFDGASADSLPKGWTRDFLLYTDGWIKDADLNTAFGNTVAPLPFHDMKEYPYAPGELYPTDPDHQRFLNEYNTRLVRRR